MPLISERSVPGWARKLARHHDEPFREVLLELPLAIVNQELPATCREPTPTPDGLKQFILTAFDMGIWQGNESLQDLCRALQPITVAAEDMNHWLESRGVVNEQDALPAPAISREDAIKVTVAELGQPGRGGPQYKKFAHRVRELCGEEPSGPGFSNDAIEQAVRRSRTHNPTKSDNPSEMQ